MSDEPESPSLPPGESGADPAVVEAPGDTPNVEHEEASEEIGAAPAFEVDVITGSAAVADPPLHIAPVFSFTLGHALWIAAAVLFAALRLGPTWQAPLGGPELLHLAGSWQASIGLEDGRYIPTFFQFLSSVLLRFSDSEVPVRVLAYLATLSIPLALYRTRRVIGGPAALLALAVLAIRRGHDLPWRERVRIGIRRRHRRVAVRVRDSKAACSWGALGILGFLCATSGPIVLPIVFAILLLAIIRREKPERPALVELIAGAVFGILVTSVAYGTGPIGLRVAPISLFFDSFEQNWSTLTTGQFLAAYSGAILLGALATAAYFGRRAAKGIALERWEVLLLAWFAVSSGWAVASMQTHSTAAATAFALPAVLLIGVALARALPAMVAADWWLARYVIPAAAAAALVATNYAIDWARVDRIGSGGEQALVILLSVAATVSLFILVYDRRSRPTLLAAALGIGILPTLSGAFGIGLSAIDEPVPSPRATIQSRQIRDLALEAIADRPGTISVHPRLEQTITWPFRESGSIEIATSPSSGATVVIWPADLPTPEGYAPLAGTWAFEESVAAPTRDALRYLRWVTNRNTLVISPEAVNVYFKANGESE